MTLVIRSTGQWRILKVVPPHTCHSSQPKRVHAQCTAKYLGQRILGIVRADSKTSVPSLVESIFAFSGYHVKYSKAWRAKQHAVALLWGDLKESYGMVARVLTAMAYYNPEVKWFTDSCGMTQPNNGVLKHVLQRDGGPSVPTSCGRGAAAYDLQHRGHLLANLHEELKPLRARVHSPLRWDERYMLYLQRVGFLDIVVQVVAGLPLIDGSLLTAMVNRWRPETHISHLPCGEMIVTMQDVAMILGLPLEGLPVTGIIQKMHISIRPPELEEGDNSKKTSGVSFAWLREVFSVCHPGGDDELVQRHTRVWLWHFVSTFLLPDAVGNT
uniref:Aminotransferase-like plant mobile domain-containing protein n=1 Tax=Setaria italica TaxID=4555 RepID=A0A0Q3VTD5_SETIT